MMHSAGMLADMLGEAATGLLHLGLYLQPAVPPQGPQQAGLRDYDQLFAAVRPPEVLQGRERDTRACCAGSGMRGACSPGMSNVLVCVFSGG